MKKPRRCVVCRLRRRVRGEKLCKVCLDFYMQKYDIKNGEDINDNPEFAQILKIYNEEADQDDD